MVALLGWALLVVCAAPAPASALSVKAIELRVDPSRSDRFVLAGRYDALALEGATDVRVGVGGLELRVPLAEAVRRGKRLRFRGPKGEPGIAALTIDTKKRGFSVKGLNLVLVGAAGPVAVELGTDLGIECAVVTLAERARRGGARKSRRTFALASKEGTGPCGVVDGPSVSPPAVVTGEPTAVVVTTAIAGTPEPGSVRLLRVDASGRPVEPVLCILGDDGATGIDAVAGDGVFACQATFTEAEPTRLVLVIEAGVGGTTVRSPGVPLDVAAPLADADVDRVLEIQAQALALWDQAVATHGDTFRARVETASALRVLAGVGAVVIARGGSAIDVVCPGGIRCGLLLPTGGDPTTPVPDSVASTRQTGRAPSPAVAIRPLAVPCSPKNRRAIKDQNVLIWDPGLLGPGTPTPFIEGVYRDAACPRLTVEVDRSGTVASVGRFGAFGTVVIVTHGSPGVFATSELVSRETLDEIKRTKKLPRGLTVKIIDGRTDFLDPIFRKNVWAIDMATATSGMFGSLDGTLVFGAFCDSALRATMVLQGASAYVGYTGPATFGWFQANARSFVANMVERYEISRAAALDADPGVAPLVGTRLVPSGGPLAYLGNPIIEPESAQLTPNGMQTYRVRLEGGDTASDCDLRYRWRNDASHGHLRGGNPPGEDEFEGPGTQSSPPVDEATYTANPDPPGLDNITVKVEPGDAKAGGSDSTRFGEACAQAIVGERPAECLTDCTLNFPGCVPDGTVEQNPSCCCSCQLRIGSGPAVCNCQEECCPNFPECEPAGTQVIHFSACCSCEIQEPNSLAGTCK